MSVDTKLPRLLAAAREFNIGQDTLIEFLAAKGFGRDDLKPTAKLSLPMYEALQREFQGDKVAKAKSDMIDLPKGSSSEPRRKREEEEISFRKEEKKHHHDHGKEIIGEIKSQPTDLFAPVAPPTPAVEEVVVIPVETKVAPTAPNPVPEPVVVAVVPDPIPAPVTVTISEPAIVAIPEPAVVAIPEPAVVVESKVIPAPIEPTLTESHSENIEISAPVVASAQVIEEKIEQPAKTMAPEVISEVQPETTVAVPEIEKVAVDSFVRIEAPELEGPKIIAKIDLAAIDSSTRPKKGTPIVNRSQDQAARPQQPRPANQPPFQRPNPPQGAPPRQNQPPVKAPLPPPPPTRVPVSAAITPSTPPVGPIEPKEDTPPVISNIQADRLTGPKVIGKIQLPVENDTRPKGPSERDKRKRKRIPLDNRPPHQQGQALGGGQQRPPFQPGQQGQQGSGQQNQQRPGQNLHRPGQNTGQGQNHGGQNLHRPGQNLHKPSGQGQNLHQGGGQNRNDGRRDDKIIDEKEIQRKLQETQARLSGGQRPGKGMKARARRDKRREMAELQHEGGEDNQIEVTEFISVSELASLMDVNFAEVIGKCMNLGIMVSINQRLDAEVIELVASEFGFDVKFVGLEDKDIDDEEEEDEEVGELAPRAPIVTIMGHVDHGKTSLLDFIRHANVVSGEAGGITQHIGAYEVTAPSGKKVTFLDTPGHEAFTAMRARGAKVTDIAVIVIAADDAVMPQTKEAISHAQAANVPMIFAVNKMDKDGANPQKIYEQLASMNILVEEWGGKFQSQEISAKKGLNIDLLLEKILLEAELLELKASPQKRGNGTVIEATLDKGRGFVTTLLVLDGTMKIGDVVVSGPYFGRVKAMFNERNVKLEEAGPASPALILGLNGAPQAGEKFKVYENESDAKQAAYKRGQILREQGMRTRKHITLDEIGRRLALGNFKELNVIIKGDVDGSVEALSDSLQKLSTQEIVVNVILKGVGAISENDVTLASASDAIILGFNVRPNLQAARLAEQEGIQIKQYSIIYNAINDIKSAMEGLLEPKIEEKEVATVEIREVYKFDKATVAGCYVQDGRLKRDAKIRLFRDGILIYPRTEGAFAELGSLKRYKDDVKEVPSNMECGLTLKNFTDIHVGDTLVSFEEEEVKRTL